MQLNYESVGSYVKAQAKGTPEEIAALVLGIQERRGKSIVMNPEDVIRAVVRSATDDTRKDTDLQ